MDTTRSEHTPPRSARAAGGPSDTDAAADAVQREIYRTMGGARRVTVAFELTEMVRRLSWAGIRSRHPDYDHPQVLRAWARLTLGDELVRALWPGQPLLDP